jgi:hypothetical protein
MRTEQQLVNHVMKAVAEKCQSEKQFSEMVSAVKSVIPKYLTPEEFPGGIASEELLSREHAYHVCGSLKVELQIASTEECPKLLNEKVVVGNEGNSVCKGKIYLNYDLLPILGVKSVYMPDIAGRGYNEYLELDIVTGAENVDTGVTAKYTKEFSGGYRERETEFAGVTVEYSIKHDEL